MNDQLEAAEAQAVRCMHEYEQFKDRDSRVARAETFRLAAMHRFKLLPISQLVELEKLWQGRKR